MKKSRLFFFLLVFVLTPCNVLFNQEVSHKGRQQTFHVLLLGDTRDSRLRSSVNMDFKKLTKSLQRISTEYKRNLRITTLTTRDNNLTLKEILRWLDKQSIRSHDVIFIYYSGHGFRYKDDAYIWPQDDITKDKGTKKGVHFKEIVKKAVWKQARLTVILLDCCNTVKPKSTDDESEEDKSDRAVFHLKNVTKERITQDGKKLFDQYGVILASASSPKELSWSKPSGGLFTNNFLISLFDEMQQNDPNWNYLFEAVRDNCHDRSLDSDYQTEYLKYHDNNSTVRFCQKPQFRLCLPEKRKAPEEYLKEIYGSSRHKKQTVPPRSHSGVYETDDFDFEALAECMDFLDEE